MYVRIKLWLLLSMLLLEKFTYIAIALQTYREQTKKTFPLASLLKKYLATLKSALGPPHSFYKVTIRKSQIWIYKFATWKATDHVFWRDDTLLVHLGANYPLKFCQLSKVKQQLSIIQSVCPSVRPSEA